MIHSLARQDSSRGAPKSPGIIQNGLEVGRAPAGEHMEQIHRGGRGQLGGGRGPRRQLLVLLTIAALTVAACGTRLSDEDRALYVGGDAASTEPGIDVSGGPSRDDAGRARTSGTAGAEPQVSAEDQRAGAPEGNDDTAAGAPAGGSDDGGPAASGGSACSAPSDEAGVSDDTITIGNVSQLSGPIPGFAQEAVNGAQAYVAHVNANGGLCGRQLDLAVADDGFDASRNASETARLEPSVLAFGGSFSVSDSGTANALSGTDVADVGIATSPERQSLANNYSHLPGQQVSDPAVAAPEWKYAEAQGATKAIIVHVAAASGRNRALVDRKNMEAAGLQVELLEVSNTQFSFAGPARAVRDSGAQILLFISDLNASVQMVTELRELDTTLQFEWYRIAYGQEFLDRAGPLAEGAMAFLEFAPFEEAGSIPEMARYQEWLQRVAPNSTPTFDSINSWIAMKLLVQAIRQVDGPITRDAVLASLGSISSFDADGLIQGMNPAEKQTDQCKVAVRVDGGRWVREAPPGNGFLC